MLGQLPNQIANGQPHDAAKILGNENFLRDAVIAVETNILANHDKYGWAVLQVSAGTRVSNTSFTITGDVTTWIQIGDKIKLTDTTTKYYYVTAVPTYSAGTGLTTIAVYGGTDYIVVGNPSSIYYSKAKSPQGFIGWFNTAAGFFKLDGTGMEQWGSVSHYVNGGVGSPSEGWYWSVTKQVDLPISFAVAPSLFISCGGALTPTVASNFQVYVNNFVFRGCKIANDGNLYSFDWIVKGKIA